ncbi:MAG: GNAT family N-acetyltransferase [Alphaproteobacteria bacterium]|nr:GNAT family N-acetyltransferase [Alphaproteobacteria bacterium]
MSISLVRLAPEPECNLGLALRFAANLAAILNFDDKLPDGIRHSAAPLETAESVLSFTKAWCLNRNARFYAIVMDGGAAIGSISLSHMDTTAGTARSGYWLGSAYHGRGYGTEALSQLIAIARDCGLKHLSATINSDNEPSRRMWEKLGAQFRDEGGHISASVDIA